MNATTTHTTKIDRAALVRFYFGPTAVATFARWQYVNTTLRNK